MKNDRIIVKGARTHNLKNIDVSIPKNKLVVITGLSGSGKSSLAFDTIYAEGRRRYVESLSPYARQFLGQMDKPDVDFIDGLSPAISIDQKTKSHNPRSTVGTVTEINNYLRLLWARCGSPICPNDGTVIKRQSIDQMIDRILYLEDKTKLMIMSPIIRSKKGSHKKTIDKIRKEGYVRLNVDGEIYNINEDSIELNKNKKHTISVVVDRIIIKKGIRSRLFDSLENALRLSNGYAEVYVIGGENFFFSEYYACPVCGFSLGELEPRLFSFNSPLGACPDCNGLGIKLIPNKHTIIPDESKSIKEGAIVAWNSDYYSTMLMQFCNQFNININLPFRNLTTEQKNMILYGSGTQNFHFHFKSVYGLRDTEKPFEGVFNNIERRYNLNNSLKHANLKVYMTENICNSCKGQRLNNKSLSVKIMNKSIADICDLSIEDALKFFQDLHFTGSLKKISDPLIKEINDRLNFLINVGLSYITLNRAANTLSGGESQRIRLATQIGSNLSGVLYVLDEPSIGLHQHDIYKLLKTLDKMKNLGNTLIVVEHDEDFIRFSDYIIDVGPGAGKLGGNIVACGTPEQIMNNKNSLTGDYLSGRKYISIPKNRRKGNGKFLEIYGASEHNLKNINVTIPLGEVVSITGVSGSGKSTLINDILKKVLIQKIENKNDSNPGKYSKIKGWENIDRIIDINQNPIGKTPRSNPATYVGVFDDIRSIFSQTNEAKIHGYSKGRFSFNIKGGRCEACKGDGLIKIEMNFLSDVYVTCDVCHGKRYNSETLKVHFKDKNIYDVLNMTVFEAYDFFSNISKIKHKLKILIDVGLGYLKLGQPATTLSGGEAQRIKLANELQKQSLGNNLYILDEPTTGLHIDDVNRLIKIISRLADAGNSIIIIEHNLDIIKTSDYVIDLGPEGGINGGQVIAKGTPEEVATIKKSYTGQYLAKILKKSY